MPDAVAELIKVFADDTKVYSSVVDEQQHQDLQDDLDRLCDWSRKWKLSFNAKISAEEDESFIKELLTESLGLGETCVTIDNMQSADNSDVSSESNEESLYTDDKQKMKILFSNVDSLSNKCSELLTYLANQRPHIIGLCEVFPKCSTDKESIIDISLQGYDKITPDNQGDRGVLLFVKSNLKVSKVSILNEAFKEAVWCEIVFKEIDWINCESTVGEEHSAAKFVNCIQDNFLFQHVKSPTRFREGQNPSCLDLVFTNEENMIDSDSLVIDSPIGKSDHAVIHFDYNCYLSFEQDTSERFQYFKGDYKAISDELDQENWDVLFEDQSIEQIWNIFKSKLSQCIEKYIPKRRHCNKFTNPPMWMDRRTKSAIIKKRRAWKKYQFSRSRVSYTNYASSRNNCTNTIREAKCKSFWKYVNSKLKTRTGVGNIMKSDGSLAINDTEKVNVLNTFFSSVFTRTEDLNEQPNVKDMEDVLLDISVTVDDVLKKLNNLHVDKSAGPDNLHPKVLYENNLLSDCQYGFRPGRSCSIQLLEVLDHWSSLLDNFCSVDTIYLDFSRAFDTVPHERLIGKLYNLGIQGKVLIG
ncbi:unnamed protein product [Mytilus edulis]|uniref:Reverse transcriptase domain-containing protein n=1 Tax=Mytilus edulis TaxID=6550 RepID=A0A8S3RR99_MYTED|nr:unnamed protein product [Mytilus edulis]